MNRSVALGCFAVFVWLDAGAGFGQSGTPQVSWITVRDAREQAFSIDVPRGWKVYGGMFRIGLVDARPFVDMTSPDGKVNMRVGDATIPPYSTPRSFEPAQGSRTAAYASGDVFAAKYGLARFKTMCDGVKVTKTDPMAPKFHPAGGGLIHTTGGDAYFTCTKNGEAMGGYVYAETMLFGPGGPNSSWYLVALASVLAPMSEGQAAGAWLKHSGASLTLNPAWAQQQEQLVELVQRQVAAKTKGTIAATAAMNAHQQQMIRGEQNDAFNDIINGVEVTRDPSTGKEYQVPLGTGGQKWVDGNGGVVESAMAPGAGFSQLQPTN